MTGSPWTASLIGVGGILLGIAAKWAVDLHTERNRRALEDGRRFMAEKQVAYAEIL
ncbi:hypothetical protein Val02_92960 [Virgisporangium aliadipatigenens]|uniref:Uncharacterized protein n=2 Tax=Virgisporangium aliadipatigenens TaxID=741659 RepID=A0A8J3YZ55_9ACTN|nr:hypothetical protein Val02_92960 [Virgisporangium aliadipatigenens]